MWLCRCDCGNIVSVVGDGLVSGNTKSCGCLRAEMKGNKHPMWKGGITKGRKKLWNCIENKNWRNKVYDKDGYTCQKCNDNKGHNLNAHHIKSWIKYPLERYNVDNGNTLCEKCHIWVHSKANINNEFLYIGEAVKIQRKGGAFNAKIRNNVQEG